MVKVLIIEDQDMARVALSVVLSKNPDIEIVDMKYEYAQGNEVIISKALENKLRKNIENYRPL